ncbi:MAG: N-acetyl-gamma-glutamyl-phosphate reductase [Clostridia bacterium]|nr:N-acetyl-gamma-glutamyl-phosphate reductase [Clostridia bacterium]
MAKVFIDGAAGTTGLAIRERLAGRRDLDLITLPEEVRKDPAARAEALNRADAAILCLPDAAAVEAVGLIDPANTHTAVIDTSTAHRTAEGWTYGFPELAGQREKIRASKRIANPGCHASGFIALAAPLRDAGILPADARLTVTSLTGYSGGGKKMIAEYEAAGRDPLLDAPRMYGLSQTHKHLPEMKAVCRLDREPIFCPIVAPFYAGMEVVLPLFAEEIGTDAEGIAGIYRSYYGEGGAVRFAGSAGEKEGGFLSAGAFAGRDSMEITVAGNGERILLTARFDNLGKGASGAAVQNMNLLLGFEEYAGLNL